MEQTVIYLSTVQTLLTLKQKILKLLQLHYAWETSRKNFLKTTWKKTGLNGYVYDFGVDYDAIAAADILDIHKYLMKNNETV